MSIYTHGTQESDMTNDILRLRDALVRDSEDGTFRERLAQDSVAIRRSLNTTGEYRVRTPKGTILIRATKKSA
jgi:hypothetical protein